VIIVIRVYNGQCQVRRTYNEDQLVCIEWRNGGSSGDGRVTTVTQCLDCVGRCQFIGQSAAANEVDILSLALGLTLAASRRKSSREREQAKGAKFVKAQ
jgi:hypothetical protein